MLGASNESNLIISHLQKFFNYYYPLDPSIPVDNQWHLTFANKYKLFGAMRSNKYATDPKILSFLIFLSSL